MISQSLDLWSLVRKRPQIDPVDLAAAVQAQVREPELDYRTRLLIRDSVEALRLHWGDQRLAEWLAQSPEGETIEQICADQFDEIGFPSLRSRLMEKTDPEDVRRYLREVGQSVRGQHRLDIAGAIALILSGYLVRHTDDVDVIDEVPKEIRERYELMEELKKSYGLDMRHMQSHYLPAHWQNRLTDLGSFGRLHVFLADKYDVFLSKLFSKRRKDKDDLRAVLPHIDKDLLKTKLNDDCGSFLQDPKLLEMARDNWQILFGEELPK
ncbi:MAG: DUF6036 family nucleotidyltransferase [Gemmataceae bacterium]|nr:DUF6036 family nucleotidyltransferase [Gemmataceae bacterium]